MLFRVNAGKRPTSCCIATGQDSRRHGVQVGFWRAHGFGMSDADQPQLADTGWAEYFLPIRAAESQVFIY